MTMHYLPPIQQRAMAPQGTVNPPNGASKYHGDVAAGYDTKREPDAKHIVEQGIIERMLSEMPEGSTVVDFPIGTGRFLDVCYRNKFQVLGFDLSPEMMAESASKIADEAKVIFAVGDVRTAHVLSRNLSPQDLIAALPQLKAMREKYTPLAQRRVIEQAIRAGIVEPPPAGMSMDEIIAQLIAAKAIPKDVVEMLVLRKLTAELGWAIDKPKRIADKIADVAVNCRITRWLEPAECQAMMREMMRIVKCRIIWTARVANHQHARTIELFESVLHPGGWRVTRNEAGYVTDYRILEARPA